MKHTDGVRWGIIGAGGISTRFAGVLAGEQGMALSAVYNRHIDRAESLAARFEGCRAVDDLDALLSMDEIRAVYIGLTNDRHLPAALRAMEAGKAVLCEKPMALSAADARTMADCAAKNGVLLMEAMWTRFLPVIRRVKGWVEEGRIGAVRLAEASFCFYSEFDPKSRLYVKEMGGGALYDVGVYAVELITGLLGRPDRVNCALHVGPSGVDDLSVVNLIYDNGAIGTATSGIMASAPAAAALRGERGSIEIPRDFYRADRAALYDGKGRLIEECTDSFEDGFIYQIRHFAGLLREGRLQSDIMPLSDSVDCAAIFDTALLGARWPSPLCY